MGWSSRCRGVVPFALIPVVASCCVSVTSPPPRVWIAGGSECGAVARAPFSDAVMGEYECVRSNSTFLQSAPPPIDPGSRVLLVSFADRARGVWRFHCYRAVRLTEVGGMAWAECIWEETVPCQDGPYLPPEVEFDPPPFESR